MPNSVLPPIRKWDTVPSPSGAVHIIHGLAEHPERYGGLAQAMNEAGLVVWAHHQRGHGENPVPGIRGHFADRDGWRAVIDDAWAVSKALADETRLPLAMFAHSMGSFVGQGVLAANGASYRAVVFSGTNGSPAIAERLARNVARLQLRVLGPRNPGLWLQKMIIEDSYNAKFGPHAPPNTWLSRDTSEVEKYTSDPDCGFPLTSRAWLDLLDARVAQSTVAFFKQYPPTLPIHIVAGTADPVGENGKGVRRLLKYLGDAHLTKVSSAFYEQARHELLHETNRETVIPEIVGWLKTAMR
jgi:alpha-beta hydrolase superfamily lysophospholipase